MYGARNFSPLFLPGLFAWYDASQVAGANGSNVASLVDLSGNGRTLVASATNPTLVAPWSNGLNAVKSAAATYFQSASGLSAYAISNGVSVLCAGQFQDQTTTRGIWDLSTPSDTQCFVTSPNLLHFTCNTDISGVNTACTAPCVIDGVYSSTGANPTNNIVRVNNVQVLNGTSGSSGSVLNQLTLLNQDALTIGGCTVGEWIVVAGILSASDFARARAYLKGKWGTP